MGGLGNANTRRLSGVHSNIFYIVKFLGKLFHLGPQAADYVAVEDFGSKDTSVWKTYDTKRM